jgi:hypothetical protein
VNGPNLGIEKGKDSSSLALVLTSAFANCGVLYGIKRDDGIQ